MEREAVICEGEEVETVTVGSGTRGAFDIILGLEVLRRRRAISRTAFIVLASWYFITPNIPSRV